MTEVKQYQVGLIGLDTGHVLATAQHFNCKDDPYHIQGAYVTYACDEGVPDFFNHYRSSHYRNNLEEQYGVQMLASPEEVAERADAIFLSSIDARQRLRQFQAIAERGAGKPVIMEKPFAISSKDAEAIALLAEQYRIPLFCSSSLRYAPVYTKGLQEVNSGSLIGWYGMGPLEMQPQLPGMFWYGVHLVELLYAAYGTGCVEVTTYSEKNSLVVVGRWKDGRIGKLRGYYQTEGKRYHALLEVDSSVSPNLLEVRADQRPDFSCFLEKSVEMMQTGVQPIATAEMLEVVKFMEAVNTSVEYGRSVLLTE